MKKTLLMLLAGAAIASASNDVSWVASTGNDFNACTRTQPCRTFAAAVSATNNNGAVHVVDSGDYGPLQIAKPLTLDGAGAAAVIRGTAGFANGIEIAGNLNGGQVTLRNLIIYPYPKSPTDQNTLSMGIDVANLDLGVVNIEDVSIISPIGSNIWGVAINDIPANLRNVHIEGGALGVTMAHLTSTPVVHLDRVTATNASQAGLHAHDSTVSVRDCVFHGSSNGYGIWVTNGVSPTNVMVERTEMSSNNIGLMVAPSSALGATVRLSNSVITANTTGVAQQGSGSLISFRNNMIAGNNTDGNPSLSISMK
jgi:hypothetical protein